MFCNHYVRDCPGALEKPIENELAFTQQDYSIMNSLYFFPNIISPLIAGVLIDKLGGIVRCFYLSLFIASFGHLSFAFGASFGSKSIMFLGKGISGSMYEIVDAVMPIIYLSALFKEDFLLVVGFCQIFLRLGSVCNFILSPYIFNNYGLISAIWVASFVGCFSIVLLLFGRYIEKLCFPSSYFNSLAKATSSVVAPAPVSSSSTTTHISTSFTTVPTQDEEADEEFQLVRKEQSPDYLTSTNSYQQSSTLSTTSSSSNFKSSSSTSSSFLSSLWNHFLELTQFHSFSVQFYFYLFAGAFLYGTIVPFWFYGSKYLQDTFGFSIGKADSVMTLPEGLVAIAGFPFGIIVTRCHPSTETKLILLSIALTCMSIALWILTYSASWKMSQQQLASTVEPYQPTGTNSELPDSSFFSSSLSFVTPITLCYFAITFLGLSFSFCCSVYWGIVNEVVDRHLINQGTGLLSCAVNIFPAILPPCFAIVSKWTGSRHSTISILAIEALLGAVCSFVAAYVRGKQQLTAINRQYDELH
jgi:MFS family permease